METKANNRNNIENMAKYADLLSKDCEKLIFISNNDRKDEDFCYSDMAEKYEWKKAYRSARLHFSRLSELGEKGSKMAYMIFGRSAYSDDSFRRCEEYYLALHPENYGKFFDNYKYYQYLREEEEEEKKSKNKKDKKVVGITFVSLF